MIYLIELLLPLYDNNKKALATEVFEEVRRELVEKFGGVTAFLRAPAEGVWKEGGGAVTRDEIVIFEVMSEQLNREWWSGYREELEKRFEQEQLIIRASQVEQL